MSPTFLIIAAVTCVAAVAALSLRRLVHCALCLTVALAGLAAVFLLLDAQFVGLAQILVYIGAVAILIVFAILLTRGGEPDTQPVISSTWMMGIGITVLVFGSLAATILSSTVVQLARKPVPDVTAAVAVRQIGVKLMTEYVLPLEVVALLLTAALVGAVIIAMQEERR